MADSVEVTAGEVDLRDVDFGLSSSRCAVCKHPERAAINTAILDGNLRRPIAKRYRLSPKVVERHTAQHLPTLWERCRVCAEQVTTGVRCHQHNPTPEEREARNG